MHGFTYTDYLTELGYADISCGNTNLGCATSNVYFKSNIGMAMTNAHKQGIKFLGTMGYTEDQARGPIRRPAMRVHRRVCHSLKGLSKQTRPHDSHSCRRTPVSASCFVQLAAEK